MVSLAYACSSTRMLAVGVLFGVAYRLWFLAELLVSISVASSFQMSSSTSSGGAEGAVKD